MKQEQFETMFSLIVMSLLVRVSYELSRQEPLKTVSFLVGGHLKADTPKKTSMTALQKEWAEKAVKGYAIAQEKKWLKWTEAMFEPDK